MEQETVEERLTRIEERLARIEERLARLEARTDDHGQQAAYLEGYLGASVDRRHLQQERGAP